MAILKHQVTGSNVLRAATAGLTMLFIAALGAPAQADLLDAKIGPNAEGETLWLSFDQTPEAVRMDGRTLIVDGVDSPDRRIEIIQPGAVSALILTAQGDGLRITLDGGWTNAMPRVREGGVMVQLTAPAPAVSRAPAPGGAAPSQPDTPSADAAPDTPSGQPSSGEAMAATDPAMNDRDPTQDAEPAPAGAMAASEPERAIIPPAAADSPCATSQAALADAPWDLDRLTAHADCLAGIGLTEQAATLYERVLAFEPDHYEAAMGLGALREASGNAGAAAALFQTAARNALTDGEALQARAAARRAAGN